jgi:hypothetical protein
MTERTALAQLILSTLEGDATLAAALPGGIWRNSAPQQSEQAERHPVTGSSELYPYCVFNILSVPSAIANDRTRIFTMPLVRILVHDEGASEEAIDALVERIDVLLEAVRGEAGDKHIRGFTRENAIEAPYDLNGVGYLRSGGDYRAFVYDAP